MGRELACLTTAPSSCFAKETAATCRLREHGLSAEDAHAQCYGGAPPNGAEVVLMAALVPGDRVLTSTGAGGALAVTRVLANHHARTHERSALLAQHIFTLLNYYY